MNERSKLTPDASGGGKPEQAKFLSGDLRRHVLVMASTGSIGLMGVFLVDLADLYFISLLGQAELAAAIGFAASLLFVTISVSLGMGIALGALVSRSCGAGDLERAKLWATHGLLASAFLACVIGGALALSAPFWVSLLGAEGRTAEFAAGFLGIVAPAMPLTALSMGGGQVLRAHGDSSRSMTAFLLAATVNGVLDPLLIFGLGLGLDGAAWASVAARGAGAGYALWAILRFHGGFSRLETPRFLADMRPYFAYAGPAMLTNAATPFGAAYVTRLMADFGDSAVAGYAIVTRLAPVAFAFVFSLSGAVGPIIGQNHGARRYGRVREALAESLRITAIYVLGASAVLFLLSGPIVRAFGAQGGAAELVYWFCGPISLLFFFNGVLFVANAAFNNLGRPLLSTQFNLARHTIGVIPPALAGAALLGAPGALLGQGLGGVIFAALAVWRARRLVDAHEAGEVEERGPKGLVTWLRPFWPFASPRD